jgi:hypothetical protein
LDKYASAGDVLSNQGWEGADYVKLLLEGLTLKSSFVMSNADTGSLKIKMLLGKKYFTAPVRYRVVKNIKFLKRAKKEFYPGLKIGHH